jgi:hypothetical protein
LSKIKDRTSARAIIGPLLHATDNGERFNLDVFRLGHNLLVDLRRVTSPVLACIADASSISPAFVEDRIRSLVWLLTIETYTGIARVPFSFKGDDDNTRLTQAIAAQLAEVREALSESIGATVSIMHDPLHEEDAKHVLDRMNQLQELKQAFTQCEQLWDRSRVSPVAEEEDDDGRFRLLERFKLRSFDTIDDEYDVPEELTLIPQSNWWSPCVPCSL